MTIKRQRVLPCASPLMEEMSPPPLSERDQELVRAASTLISFRRALLRRRRVQGQPTPDPGAGAGVCERSAHEERQTRSAPLATACACWRGRREVLASYIRVASGTSRAGALRMGSPRWVQWRKGIFLETELWVYVADREASRTRLCLELRPHVGWTGGGGRLTHPAAVSFPFMLVTGCGWWCAGP